MSTFSHPVIHYQIEKSAETHGQRFFESNSFHLIIQKGKDGKLHKSEPVLSYICSDPLVALRFILERFETIIFLSNQIPISVEKDKSKEKLSQILRINYFNRKSQFSFNTKFYDIQADIYGFYRYQKKGADQTLLLSSEKDIQPSLALNYQKFVQQRSTQSRDGVVIYTPNKQFSARLIQRLKDQNLSLSTFQSSFIISPDQIESASVKKFYRLSCNIGRGGLLVTNFNDTHSNEFTQQYNSISLILGVPFPQKSLRNKLFTFYDFRVFDKQPGDLWHQMAARNIIGSCSGQTALICADMRYSLQIQKWFPRWFLKYFQEEGAGCLHELKNWVINKSE
ncbi:TFIIH basal transcription factor complex helicase subunit [Spironucleus salmonicida]|nr:TFIIH basal transcription factor complex helicase subunit [Spironucleus salmonicida]